MTTTIRSSFILIVAVVFLMGYSFMSASWTAAPANPPNNNAEAPITVSDTAQTKDGRLNLRSGSSLAVATTGIMFRTNGTAWANIQIAAAEMRSPQYCDASGNNCFDTDTIDQFVQSRTCPTGQFMRGVNADGTLVCAVAATNPPAATCRVEYKTVGGCYTSSPNLSCGAGWTKIGVRTTGASCSTNGQRYSQQCSRNVCS
jgi:hypothetical protein